MNILADPILFFVFLVGVAISTAAWFSFFVAKIIHINHQLWKKDLRIEILEAELKDERGRLDPEIRRKLV